MIEQPQFRTVLRGFDPDQVAEAVKDLHTSLVVARRTAADRTVDLSTAQQEVQSLRSQLAAAQAKVGELEQHSGAQPTTGYGDLGARISSMLSLAQEEAAQLRTEAEDQARQTREAADADAMRMRSAAQSSADEIVRRATEDAATRRQAADTEVADNVAQHEARLTDLREQADRLAQTVDQAREEAHGEGRRILDQAREEAHQLRHETEVQLAQVAADRDEIHSHLGQVHQALADLIASGRVRAEATAAPVEPEQAPDGDHPEVTEGHEEPEVTAGDEQQPENGQRPSWLQRAGSPRR